MQPYFVPYIGYFQLIKQVDQFVILDDVNFTKKGWTHRNNILINSNGEFKPHLFSLSLREASQNVLIQDIERADIEKTNKKFLTMIQQAYSKAPHFEKVFSLVKEFFLYKDASLSKFNLNSLKIICNYLEIKTNFLISSSLDKNNSLKSSDKIIEICRKLNTKTYINPIGGLDLYCNEDFKIQDIELKFIKVKNDLEYRQFHDSAFTPHLSIIDVLMFNSVTQVNDLLNQMNFVQPSR